MAISAGPARPSIQANGLPLLTPLAGERVPTGAGTLPTKTMSSKEVGAFYPIVTLSVPSQQGDCAGVDESRG